MASKADRLPVIIGVGQVVDHWDGSDPSQAPHPVEMIRTAISRALGDTGTEAIADAVDLAINVVITIDQTDVLHLGADFHHQ